MQGINAKIKKNNPKSYENIGESDILKYRNGKKRKVKRMKKEERKRMTIEEALNNKNFENEYGVIIVNNDKPFTFTKEDYEIVEGRPSYTNAKKNKRSGSAIAVVSKNTLAIYTSENIDYPAPLGWTKKLKEARFYNKSHIIAYSLSAKKCDSDNIFIGTEYLNKITMKNIETDIYKRIKDNKRKYLYKVSPKYKTENSSIPYAVLIEAETIDEGKKETICRLCYNIQKGKKVDYYKKADLEYKSEEKEDRETSKYKHYSINVKTKMFHLLDAECKCISKIEMKYIQETKANEEDIKSKGFKLCKKCTNYYKKRG